MPRLWDHQRGPGFSRHGSKQASEMKMWTNKTTPCCEVTAEVLMPRRRGGSVGEKRGGVRTGVSNFSNAVDEAAAVHAAPMPCGDGA
mmetsp:Transcript_113144/g.300621  ORF Transcript_113144/g.300621 Transcript_113144/m.300621 type:complete len:87 (+) Transcript_113144:707-967(+)